MELYEARATSYKHCTPQLPGSFLKKSVFLYSPPKVVNGFCGPLLLKLAHPCCMLCGAGTVIYYIFAQFLHNRALTWLKPLGVGSI